MKKTGILIMTALISISLSAQETKSLSTVILNNGMSISGYVESQPDGSYKVTSESGDVFYYSFSDVKSVKKPSAQNQHIAKNKFNTLSFSYHPIKYELNGFSLEWNRNIKVSKSTPLYFGYGLGIQYSSSHRSDRLLSARIPLEFLYRINIPNTKIAIAPYAGFDAIVYLFGQYDGYDFTHSKKNRRINIDWHIGAKFIFNNKWFLGAAYESQIMKFNEYSNISQANISIGLLF
ncbi:MAG: hypothetical protein MJY77_07515 [Bacteroidaceae bacterium]|nr:hypothetical protein [Bacteroidaceae bacterium]